MAQMGTTRSVPQESIYRALSDLNPALADLYEGARCILAMDQPLPGWARFVPHAIREIIGRLPDSLEIVTGPRIEYANRLDAIATRWEGAGLPLEGFGYARQDQTAATPTVEVPIELLEEIASLVLDNHERLTRRERLRRLVDTQAPEASRDASNRWVEQLSSVQKWAERHAHQPTSPLPGPALDAYRAEFDKFEAVIAGLLAEYGPNKGALDDILADTNRRAD